MDLTDLPLADLAREDDALTLFRLDMSPEEYAVRFGDAFVMFPFDDSRYRHPGLTEWVRRLGDILFQRNGAPSVNELRRSYLTPGKIQIPERYELG